MGPKVLERVRKIVDRCSRPSRRYRKGRSPGVLKFLLKPVSGVFLSISPSGLIVTKTYEERQRKVAGQKGEGKISMASACQLRLARRAATKWKWDFAFYPRPVTNAPCSRTSRFCCEDAFVGRPSITDDDAATSRKKKKKKNPPISAPLTMIVLVWRSGELPRKFNVKYITKQWRYQSVWIEQCQRKMSRRRANSNRPVDAILTCLLLTCSFLAINCQQGTFLQKYAPILLEQQRVRVYDSVSRSGRQSALTQNKPRNPFTGRAQRKRERPRGRMRRERFMRFQVACLNFYCPTSLLWMPRSTLLPRDL